MRSVRAVGRLAVAAPVCVPALYAWGVSVVPAVWGRAQAPRAAVVAALAAPVILALGTVLEQVRGYRIRSQYLLGFTLACGVCWVTAASPSQPLLETPYAVLGVLAWGALAWSWAAPSEKAQPGNGQVPVRAVSKVQDAFPRRAAIDVAIGVLVAIGLQLPSFEAKSAERALLFRLLAVAGSLAAIGFSAALALRRVGRRKPR